jgi:hypothetical protein
MSFPVWADAEGFRFTKIPQAPKETQTIFSPAKYLYAVCCPGP